VTDGERQVHAAVTCRCHKEEPMRDLQAIADRVEIEALRGERLRLS
jgi:hypothetical protein